jgi:hypothetical protein
MASSLRANLLGVQASGPEREEVRRYVERRLPDDMVIHLEKAASERVGSVPHDIWDVHCENSRWWAITNPLNVYSQEDFKSRDVVLTFHVGLAIRVASQRDVPITDAAASLLPGAWRRWRQAGEALGAAREAEDFQAIGMRLRECLVSVAGEVAHDDLVPEGTQAPRGADVVGWLRLLMGRLAGGRESAQLRSYLHKVTKETWDYVNWLTHAKNARYYDAEIGVGAVSHLLAAITAARLRWAREGHRRCEDCGSYSVGSGRCQHCGWVDSDYEPPPVERLSEEELVSRRAEPCTPSSDISTFVSPDDLSSTTQAER